MLGPDPSNDNLRFFTFEAQHLINVLALDQRHFNVVSKFLRCIPALDALRNLHAYIYCVAWKGTFANIEDSDQPAHLTSLFAHSIKSLNGKSENCDLSLYNSTHMA